MPNPKRGDLVIVVGGGRFGSQATEIARNQGAHSVVIDSNLNCKARELVDRVVSHAVKATEMRGTTLMLADDAADAFMAILKIIYIYQNSIIN